MQENSKVINESGMQGISKLIEHGVPSNYHFTERDYIDEAHPLEISFHIDEETTKISSAIFNCNIERISETTGEVVKDFEAPEDFIKIYVDGNEKATISDMKDILNLTQWISTPGWHEVLIHSNLLIKIKAQLNIRSYVSM
jgi:hypothetical protein